MRVLREQRPMLMGDEERHNLLEGLADIRYVRDFLALMGPDERGRFDEADWGYGDPTYMGGDQMEVFDSQLRTVVHTLFATDRFTGEDGSALQTSLHHASVAMGEDELTGSLLRSGGGPVRAEYIDRIAATSIAEQLQTEAQPETGQSPAREWVQRERAPKTGPGVGVAPIGLAKLNAHGFRVTSRAADEVEDITAVEVSGCANAIADLEQLMLVGCGEGDAPLIYRWKADSTEQRMLGEKDAILMLCGEELFGVRPFFHDVFFARLLAAWKQMNSTQGGKR